MRPSDYSFFRYLEAKKSVDDKALNAGVMKRLGQEVAAWGEKQIEVLEVGAGIGTMAQRLIETGMLKRARYRLTDLETENLERAREYLMKWVAENRLTVLEGSGNQLHFARSEMDVRVEFQVDDATADAGNGGELADVLVANAVLDLLDLQPALAKLMRRVRPGGLCYFTINYDGMTIFEPEIDERLDAEIRRLYDVTMDERVTDGKPSGDSWTGRHLFGALEQTGATVLATGSSDWMVYATDGRYPNDEAYFLHFIIHTVYEALRDRPELNIAAFAEWTEERHAQIERGELVYIAHQLDYLARKR
ncbi:MAG: class I SAM-dependent methyltransferase [Anaerolineae bacterium]|nr:MAG: class I SAM-dependent methyltransferase [Anaerolineae bacterium]